MNKEHIEQLAKDFCEAQGLDNFTRGKYGLVYVKNVVADFLISMIEKGEVVTTEKAADAVGRAMVSNLLEVENLTNRIKELEKEVQHHRDNQVTTAKLISDEDIEAYIHKQALTYTQYHTSYKSAIDVVKWMREQLSGRL